MWVEQIGYKGWIFWSVMHWEQIQNTWACEGNTLGIWIGNLVGTQWEQKIIPNQKNQGLFSKLKGKPYWSHCNKKHCNFGNVNVKKRGNQIKGKLISWSQCQILGSLELLNCSLNEFSQLILNFFLISCESHPFKSLRIILGFWGCLGVQHWVYPNVHASKWNLNLGIWMKFKLDDWGSLTKNLVHPILFFGLRKLMIFI
jgi:hypothetical protein